MTAAPAGGGNPPGPFGRAAEATPLVVVVLVLLSTGAAILPRRSLLSFAEVELTLTRLLLIVAIAALIVAPGGMRRRTLLRTGLEIPLALLILVSLVATLKWGTEARLRFLLEGIALFYVVHAVARRSVDARPALAWVALVALALSALTGIAQVSQGAPTGFYRQGCTPVTVAPPRTPPDSLTRATGTFSNPNVLAGHLLLVGPLAALAAAALPPPMRGARMGIAVALALGGLALVFTFSRTAVLAAVVAVAAGALAAGGRRARTVAAASAAIGLIAAVLLASCGAGAATATYGRSVLWHETVAVIADNPLTGVGLGRLGDVLDARDPRSSAPHAHNLFLTWWAEAGTGALVAWVAIFGLLTGRALRATRAGDPAARMVFVALLAFALFSLFDHPANVDRVAAALWVVAGLAAASSGAPAAGRDAGADAAATGSGRPPAARSGPP